MTTTPSLRRASSNKRSTIAKGLVLWLVGVLILTIFLAVLAWQVMFKQHSVNNVTVGDVMAGKQTLSEEQQDRESSQSSASYRIAELAKALGLPNGAVPDGAMEMGLNRDQARMYVIDLVNQAVAQGKLTPVEADGVLKAYDEGLVSAPVNITSDDTDDGDANESPAPSGSGSSN